jgi:hypothetical protein
MKRTLKLTLLTCAACLVAGLPTQAQNYLWTGAENNDYSTAGNWDIGSVPDLSLAGTKAFLGGTANYDGVANGDFTISTLGRLTVTTGGSFTQTNGVAWMNFQNGLLIVQSGASFNTGTAANLLRNTNTSISVTGTFIYDIGNFSTDVASNGTFDVFSGANLEIAGEFNLGADFTFQPGVTYIGGSVVTALNSTEILTVDGASLSIVDNAASQAGFFGFNGSTNYVDFTSKGGTITLSNVDGGTTEVSNVINNGIVRRNGLIDPLNITFSDLGGGNYEISAVPEPASYGFLVSGLALGLVMLHRQRR